MEVDTTMPSPHQIPDRNEEQLKVKSIVIGLLLSLAVSGAANAQFKARQEFIMYDNTDLECVPIGASEIDRRVPVYKIDVSITLDERDYHLKELYVAHHTIHGNTYVRSDQYDNSHIWKTPDRQEWYWNGQRGWGTMKGEVWHSADAN
jgi:hypothetical protein